ncbi:2736_t:CDS:2, partial [Acaulospora morrowiae]
WKPMIDQSEIMFVHATNDPRIRSFPFSMRLISKETPAMSSGDTRTLRERANPKAVRGMSTRWKL